jgi:hypothetical protein
MRLAIESGEFPDTIEARPQLLDHLLGRLAFGRHALDVGHHAKAMRQAVVGFDALLGEIQTGEGWVVGS